MIQLFSGKQLGASIATAITAIALLTSAGATLAQGVNTITKTIIAGANAKVGEEITYQIAIGCNADPSNCGSLTLIDNIASELEFSSSTASASGFTCAGACGAGQSGTITLSKPAFNGGDTLIVELKLRVKPGTPAGTTIGNAIQSTISTPSLANGGPTKMTLPTNMTTGANSPKWSTTKVKSDPLGAIQPGLGQDVSYRISFCSDTLVGNEDLTTLSLVDTFPVGATVVAADGGVVGANTITWDLASFTPGILLANLYAGGATGQKCLEKNVTVNYPAGAFPLTTMVTNNITYNGGTASVAGPVCLNTPASKCFTDVTNTISPAVSIPAPSKSAAHVSPGNTLSYSIGIDITSANSPVQQLEITDTFPTNAGTTGNPSGLVLTGLTVSSGAWTTLDVSADIAFSTTAGCGAATFTVNPSTQVTGAASVPLTVPAGALCVRWRFYKTGDTFATDTGIRKSFGFSAAPTVTIPTLAAPPHVYSPALPAVATNCIIAKTALSAVVPACASPNIEDATPAISSQKTLSAGDANNLVPFNEDLNNLYTTRLRFIHIANDSTGPVVNPVVADLLPATYEFVKWSAYTGPMPAPNLEVIPNYGGSGRTMVRYTWNAVVPSGSTTFPSGAGVSNAISIPNTTADASMPTMDFQFKIKAGTAAGSFTNDMVTFDNGPRKTCDNETDEFTANIDFNGNGTKLVTEKFCKGGLALTVISSASLEGKKFIKSSDVATFPNLQDPTSVPAVTVCPDEPAASNFTRFPCVARGLPGSAFDYRIDIANSGNEPLNNYVLYDVLPYPGDLGVTEPIATVARGSQFRVTLTGPVTIDVGASTANAGSLGAAIFEYNPADGNSCRPEVSAGAIEAPAAHWQPGCNNTWVINPLADTVNFPLGFASVKSFRIKVAFGTPFAPTQKFVINVPMLIPTSAPPTRIAWNTFGHRASNSNTSSRLPTAAPRRVGIFVPERYRVGNLVWLDSNRNGRAEAGEPALAGVDVKLVRDIGTAGLDAGDTVVATTTTDLNGKYLFEGLPAGNYFVIVPTTQVTTPAVLSTLLPTNFGKELTPNSDGDNNQNATNNVLAAASPVPGIASGLITLGAVAEPTNEVNRVSGADDDVGAPINTFDALQLNANVDKYPDNLSNLSVDFGFHRPFSLGNRVWLDVNNNGILDGGELGINGVTVNLLDSAGVAIDGDSDTAGVQAVTTTTDATGHYRFDNLPAGDYIVEIIAPAGLTSSTGVNGAVTGPYEGAAGPDADAAPSDTDDNGNVFNGATGAIRSKVVTLGTLLVPAEPTGETDIGTLGAGPHPDLQNNLTVDFGLFRSFSLGNRVWLDTPAGGGTANNAIMDGTETGPAGVVLKLKDALGVDIDGDPVTAGTQLVTVTTTAGGYYRFDNLLPGSYIVEVVASNFTAGQPLANLWTTTGAGQEDTPNADVDRNDNGIDVGVVGAIQSGVVILGTAAVPAEPTGEADLAASGQGPHTGFPDAQANMTVDFGFTNQPPGYSLGNRVWLDANNNGGVDGTESGIDGVTVQIWATDALGVPTGSAPIATQTTAAGGYYLFKTLLQGNYRVVIPATNFASGAILSGWYSSGTVQVNGGGTLDIITSTDTTSSGTNKDHGSRINGNIGAITSGSVVSNVYVLGPGNNQPITEDGNNTPGRPDTIADDRSNLTADFGFYTMNIGNLVFRDDGAGGGVVNDGIRNGSEAPIAGVAVSIYNDTNGDGVPDGAALGSATTDANGNYLFAGMAEGIYVIEATIPMGLNTSAPTTLPANLVSNDNKNHGSKVGAVSRTGSISLFAASAPTGEVAAGALNPLTLAGALPSSLAVPDSNVNSTIDFGFLPTFSIGNRVFSDPNNNGKQDAAELPLPNVQLRLLSATGTPIAGVPLQTTDAQGYYRFDDIPAGSYIVEVIGSTLEIGATSSTGSVPGDNGDKGLDAPVSGNFRSSPVTVGTGLQPLSEADHSGSGRGAQGPNGDAATNSTIDFGFVPPKYSIGNRVWRDSNNDGLRQAAEPGIANVVVSLFAADAAGNPTGAVLTTMNTDASGYYRFDNLNKGDYVVLIDKANFQPAAVLRPFLSSTPTQANPNTDIDNDDNGVDAPNPESTGVKSGKITVGPAQLEPAAETDLGAGGQGPHPDSQANMTIDFGFYPLSSLGDRVWLDTNGNGIQDAGETGIPGVSVKLLDGLGNPFLDRNGVAVTTTTDSNGNYLFKDLPVGSYQVKFMPPAGYVISPKDSGADDAVDSDADPITMSSSVIALGSDQTNLTLDAGLFFTASLGDRVWHDLNKNGIQDAGEPGVPNVTVNLLDAVTNVVVATTTTDASGNYSFPALTPGRAYVVEFTNLPATYQFTTKGSGTSASDVGDSDANTTTGRTDPITLVSGQNDPNWDAGIFGQIDLVLSKSVAPTAPATGSPYNTGDTVEYTVAVVNNGPATALAGYTVKDIVPVGVSSLVVTSSSGFSGCTFSGQVLNCTGTADLPAGSANALAIRYTGVISAISGSLKNVAFVDKAPTDPSVETNPLGTPPTSATNTATSTTNNDAEATIVVNAPTYSIGNRVWIDTNNDGIQNNGEAGRDGVAVELLSAAGSVIATTVTIAGGFYRFDNLPAGDYFVQIAAANFGAAGALPSFKSSTGAGQEGNPNSDGDRNDNGLDTPVGGAIRSAVVTLGPTLNEPIGEADVISPPVPGEAPDNRSNLTVDFGFFPTFSLGNRVWNDTNANGLRDASEIGIAGASVKLLDPAGTVIATTSTDSSGYYRFDNLPAGNYLVEVVTPTGLTPTLVPATGGAPDNSVDNDNNGTNPVAGGVRSGTVTLGPLGAEPTSEADLSSSGQGGADSNANMTVDFGFTPPSTFSLGNRVWNDTNGNGLRESGEAGIAGATVKLLDATGTTVIATTTTDANGYYRFDNLPAAGYIVEVSTPSGLTPTLVPTTGGNPNNDVDNDNNGANAITGGVRTALVTLGPTGTEPTGEIDVSPSGQGGVDNNGNMTVDVGFTPVTPPPPPPSTFSLGNRVWNDTNGNGLRESGEAGIAGATVKLLDATGTTVIATTTTDANGYYRFDNLPAAGYIVEVSTPSGLTPTLVPTTGGNPNNDVDNDNNGANAITGGVRTALVTLGPTGTEPTGEIDVSPSGQGGVDNNGNMTVDVGFTPVTPPPPPPSTFSLGNRVWNDTNGNGLRESGEAGIAGATVKLLDATGTTVIATTTTDANGYYRFDNLPAAGYIVEVSTPSGLTPTLVPTTGGNPNNDVDNDNNGANAITGGVRTALVTLGPTGTEPTGEIDVSPSGQGGVDNNGNMTVDVGFTPVTPPPPPPSTFSLGNRVWNDTNGNGLRESGEAGIAGATVKLLNATGTTVIATTTTDANGYYRFDNLPAAGYIVEVSTPSGLTPTLVPTTGGNPNNDVDNDNNGANAITGGVRTALVTLGPTGTEPTGEIDVSPSGQGGVDNNGNMTVDVGFTPVTPPPPPPPPSTFSLGNRVWNDTNGNGLRESGEAGIAGATVKLLDATGTTVIATTTTDANGYYRFDNLPAAGYIVEVSTPSGLTPTLVPTTGGNPNNDVDNDNNGANAITGGVRTALVTLGPTGTEPTGEIDVSPSGQGGVDNNGNMTVDVGFTPVTPPPPPPSTFSLGNRVWNDTNGNGLRESGEAGIAGATVKLLDATGTTVIATTTTDANGYYRFDNLPAAGYIVEVSTPSGLTPTLVPTTGGNPNNDVDNDNNGANAITGGVRTALVTLGPTGTEPTGEIDVSPSGQGGVDNNGNMTVDVGFRPLLPNTYSVGNRVWLDANANGVRDGAEPGIAGLTVRLLAGNGALTIATTTTDANGFYRFGNLPSGNYQVEVVMPAGYTPTIVPASGANPNNDVDNDNNGVATVNGALRANAVTAGPGSTEPTGETDLSSSGQGSIDANGNMTVDFGLRTSLTASLGDFVWSDTNKDGIQDAGEPGLAGVKVYLFQNGVVIASTVTDAGGKYVFANLTPGVEYVVGADKLPGYTFSSPGAGTDRATDSNANVTTGRSTPVVLAAGENNPTVDFGMFPPNAGQPIQLVKTLYEGLSNGAGCPTAKVKLVVVDKTGTGIDVTYCFKVTNPGPAHMTNVRITDTKLDLGTNGQVLSIGTLTQVPGSGVLPLAPGASITFFRTTKIIGSLTNVATVEGTPANAAGVPTGGAPSTASSGSAILASIIDPPSVLKVGTLAGANLVEWKMVWINSSTEFAANVTIVDPIPVDNGFAGTLTCVAKGTSITKSCDFIAPTAANPRGSVVWSGSVGIDNGRPTEATALNAIVISFRATVTPGIASVSNQATSSWDYDGDGVPELTNVLSDDPALSGEANPTRLQLIPTNQQVPTLSEWALILLIMLMLGFAYRELKRGGRFNNN